MQLSGLWPPVRRRNPNGDVARRGLGVLHHNVEILVVREDASVDQLVFWLEAGAGAIGCYEIAVREWALRIFVETLQVAVRWRGIEIVVVLLDILAVIALAAGQTEEAFLQD